MTGNFQSYPAYKDSGVPWLGKVPEHWEVRRTKTLFQSRKQLNTDGSETNVLSLTLRGVVNNDPDNPEGLVPKDYKTYQIFEKDDLVFKLIDLENIRTSRVGLVHERGIMSPAYVRLTLSGIGEIRFYYQQFFDLYQRSIYNQIGEGVRSTIGWSDLANLRILAPPLPEQTAIVRFLDYVDRLIRRYILAKQKLIKLFEEYRQALIHEAVTGQIDVRTGQPYPAYKDSGVQWLGKVPRHWDVVAGHVCFVERKQPNIGLMETTVLSLSYGRIVVKPVEKLRGLVPASFETYQIVDPGDIVCRPTDLQNDQNSLRFGLVRNRGIITSAYMSFRTTGRLDSNFGYLLLHAYDIRKIFYGLGSGLRQNLDWRDFKRLPCLVPPLTEQTAIVRFLEGQTARIDAAIAATRREIELLREYRERLIADVVTGKVDVRSVKCEVGSVNDETKEDEVGWEESHHEDGDAEDGLEREMREADTDEEV